MNTTNTETGTETVACLLWAGVQTGIHVEEKGFPTKEEAVSYVRALRRRGRTSWLKGDKRYAAFASLTLAGIA